MGLTSLINFGLFLAYPFAMMVVRKDAGLAAFFSESIGFLGDMASLFTLYQVAFRGAKLRTGGPAIGLFKYALFTLLWIFISHIHQKEVPLGSLLEYLSSPETVVEILLLRGPRALVLSGLLFMGFANILALPFAFTGVLWVVYFTLGQIFFDEAVNNAPKLGTGFDPAHPLMVASYLKFARYLVEPLQAIAIGQLVFFRLELEVLLVTVAFHILSTLTASFVLASKSALILTQVIEATSGHIGWTAGKEHLELAYFATMLVLSYNIHLSGGFAMLLARLTRNQFNLSLTPWTVHVKKTQA